MFNSAAVRTAGVAALLCAAGESAAPVDVCLIEQGKEQTGGENIPKIKECMKHLCYSLLQFNAITCMNSIEKNMNEYSKKH